MTQQTDHGVDARLAFEPLVGRFYAYAECTRGHAQCRESAWHSERARLRGLVRYSAAAAEEDAVHLRESPLHRRCPACGRPIAARNVGVRDLPAGAQAAGTLADSLIMRNMRSA